MTKEKQNDVLYITHSGEFLIWLLIILCVVIILFIANVGKGRHSNEYNIFMSDVDGLIVGSPVRTMGIEVGHITKIKPTNQEVFVKFIITDKSVVLPQGTKATVEFSGMAGSKSLELYLPNEKTYIDSSVPLLTVEPPRRLHDAFGMLNDMFKRMGNMIYTASNFGSKLGTIDFPEGAGKPKEAKDFLNYANEAIDIQQQRVDDFGRKINDANSKRKK